jgi:hypothetical protein
LIFALAPPLQHEHPGPWADFFGLSALRSLVSWALRVALLTTESFGAVISTRGAGAAQAGQSQGSA